MEQNASRMSALLKKQAEGNGEQMQDFDSIARTFVYGGSSTRKKKAPGPHWMYYDSVCFVRHHDFITHVCSVIACAFICFYFMAYQAINGKSTMNQIGETSRSTSKDASEEYAVRTYQ